MTEQIEIAGIRFVNGGAVCGQWWKGDNAHTDEGYHMVDLFDDASVHTQCLNYGWNAQ